MLGDTVYQTLQTVGVTQQRVERWLGTCCCEERREKLNQIDMLIRRILRGKIESIGTYVGQILGD